MCFRFTQILRLTIQFQVLVYGHLYREFLQQAVLWLIRCFIKKDSLIERTFLFHIPINGVWVSFNILSRKDL